MFRFNITYRATSVANLSDTIEDLRDRLELANSLLERSHRSESDARCKILQLQNEIRMKSQT